MGETMSLAAPINGVCHPRFAAVRAEFERKAAEVVAPAPAPVPLRPVAPVAPAASVARAPSASVAAAAPAAPVAEQAAPSRYASMGVLDEVGASGMDLDAVLRRRRAAS